MSNDHDQGEVKIKDWFREQVPEIEGGTVEIVGVARAEGYRTKVAVRSQDPGVNHKQAKQSCLEEDAKIVKGIEAELGRGEKVQIIQWDPDFKIFVKHALLPYEPDNIEDVWMTGQRSCEALIAKEEDRGLAIGKSGRNLRLAERLTGWKIIIVSPVEAGSHETDNPPDEEEDDSTHSDELVHEGDTEEENKLFPIIKGILSRQLAEEAKRIQHAAETIKAESEIVPEVVVVTETGLDKFTESLDEEKTIYFADIPGFPDLQATRHSGRLVLGTQSGRGVAVLHGRARIYEGRRADVVVRPLRSLALLGAKTLLTANFASSRTDEFDVPSMMLITGYENITGDDIATGPDFSEFGQTDCYDPELLETALKIAKNKSEVPVYTGTYTAVAGPTLEVYETVKLDNCGTDAVGISTVHEVVAAQQAGMRVLGLSALVSDAIGDPSQKVMDVGALLEKTERISDAMAQVLAGILDEMG